MDLDDPRTREVFFAIHSMLPREGPGNRASTARALSLAGPLPARPRVLDIACGPGAQTMDIAGLLPDARIVALDLHCPFLGELRRRAAAGAVADRVAAVRGDMAALPFAAASFDLLWCEGAAYIMGAEAALRSWRPLLALGGRLALSEAVWLAADPPEKVRRCWDEYPAMRDAEGCRALVRGCGWRLLGDFVLPAEAWWEYYAPLEPRLDRLERKYAGDALAEAVLREQREEIALYRDHGDCYGYMFLVMAA